MTEKITGVILDITRHNDRHNVVTLFTRSRGRVAFLSPVGTGKAGRVRNSRLQPLAVIEADIHFRPNGELQKLGQFSLSAVWGDIYFNPIKSMVALFLSEFLNRLLRAAMPDESLYDYIVGSLELFDRISEGVSDFHITFLSSLLPFMGIQPDLGSYRRGRAFDMQNGVFTDTLPLHRDILVGEEARWAMLLGRVNYGNVRALRLTNAGRREILDRLLQYYSIHFPGTGNLRSLEILRELGKRN